MSNVQLTPQAATPESKLLAATMMTAMKWEQKSRTAYHSAHWRYLDPVGRVVAVVCSSDSEIYSAVYEEEIPLGQYSSLDGAKWIVEQWHLRALEAVGGQYDGFRQAEQVVNYHLKKKAAEAHENNDPNPPDKEDSDE